jgi:hypothetical protein
MREKGIISQAEYDSAVRDLSESAGQRAPDQGTVVLGKWATTVYGFVEGDNIFDSTRSFNEGAGNSLVAKGEAYAGQNPRYMVSVRNSRLGFRLKAPEVAGIRASAVLEFDLSGTQTATYVLPTPALNDPVSEGNYFSNPIVRVRHAYLKAETPVVDVLFGQTWSPFGFVPNYSPATVELQGVPGQVFSRTPQLRISKTFNPKPVTIEVILAATRPVQRDSGTPDGQGGIRVAIDSWTGVQTVGSTGTQISPLSVAASALLRHVAVDQSGTTSPKYNKDLGLSAFAFDAFVPVIPGTKSHKDNSFSLQGEYATGYGFADMYTGLTGGVTIPALPNPMMMYPPPTYPVNIDAGIITFDSGGGLHGIEWTSMLFGAQYYLPGLNGAVFVTGNYSHISTDNGAAYVTLAQAVKQRDVEDWFDVNLFVDPTPALRLGIEYANFNDMYFDGHHAINHRGQLSGFFIF